MDESPRLSSSQPCDLGQLVNFLAVVSSLVPRTLYLSRRVPGENETQEDVSIPVPYAYQALSKHWLPSCPFFGSGEKKKNQLQNYQLVK